MCVQENRSMEVSKRIHHNLDRYKFIVFRDECDDCRDDVRDRFRLVCDDDLNTCIRIHSDVC